MKYIKMALITSVLLGMNVFLCGAFFFKAEVQIDTEKNKVYKQCSVFDFSSKNNIGINDAYCVTGTVKDYSKNKKKLLLEGESGSVVINCDTSNITDQLTGLGISEHIQVFGTAKKGIFDKEVELKADSINKTIVEEAGDIYFLKNGKYINKEEMIQCYLNKKSVSYYVPKSWKDESVEINIQDNEIGYIEGYQYVLNKVKGTEANSPESFFVCYFDYDENLLGSTKRDKVKLIEKAIAENIEDGEIVDRFPTREEKTYFGRDYDYYLGAYNKSLQVKDDCKTEYVFIQDGEDGLVMFLYVYNDPVHIDDIMFVTRFLEIY